MKAKLVRTKNLTRLWEVVEAIKSASSGEPRLGLIYGPAGRGKTRAVDHLAAKTGAVYVSAARVWTPNAMLKCILAGLGGTLTVSAADNLTRAAEALGERLGVPSLGNGLLIVDEADYLAKGAQPPNTPPLLDTVRDLHDASGAPVLLVGMDGLAKILSRFAQFWDRVRMSEEFAPLDSGELIHLAGELAGLSMDEPSAEVIRRATHGNLRQAIVHLARLEAVAKAQGSQKVRPEWAQKISAEVARGKLRASGARLKVVK
ncbi:MAG: AAA family ATPase [Desulfarculus sp.]|nr:AAA family ATPase [Pseudomonadota bacterium]MBV1736721.1 AAA family ATPase [Desulfarculus sp.]MCG2763242.1 AAA family ATPase [Desulfarculaceae bacterium]MBU4382954.1 AAA family ATPase [Pseudomonadota bacterium]MBU4567316.1 AAA family ATPase [Pseudomonadota bacterium]